MKYRKKPVVIEAMQWLGNNESAICEWADGHKFESVPPEYREEQHLTGAVRDDLHGGTWIPLAEGDWVIRGVKGEFYPCAAAVFAETYEEVTE